MQRTYTQKELEELTRVLAGMNRHQLIDRLRRLDCGFEIDFSDEYLRTMSIERLRHILLAATLQDRTQHGESAS